MSSYLRLTDNDIYQDGLARNDDTNWFKMCTKIDVDGSTAVGRPRKTCQSSVSDDVQLLQVNVRDAADRATWRRAKAGQPREDRIIALTQVY